MLMDLSQSNMSLARPCCVQRERWVLPVVACVSPELVLASVGFQRGFSSAKAISAVLKAGCC